ncbi:hypothetical protein, variant [Sphaeroforma arctica JP610]|uniref:Repressor of RNA polymerase III transcription n=1 Tax=Sphaeroforma arctica JP610 TaxID=667725 RepID=A0A0L0FUR7_9EUKA|nr:hypothetical protein, variant [Sphaeroforma arctica JP610]KNC80306.1 hypothetical protein, variant [Sphaeroforma arctica JP610]|eukprot:XP_014154208.1 hypothetical protein, variant [Sphaeroforma arctica JP610]
MKYLDVEPYQRFSSYLSCSREGQSLQCQLESYSCKNAGSDRKKYSAFAKENGHSPAELQALSPPNEHGVSMSFASGSYPRGSICSEDLQITDRKTIYYLMSTLNSSFPDYDFTEANSQQFSRVQNVASVLNVVNTQLRESIGEEYAHLQTALWAAIDQEIKLDDCEIYSYSYVDENDPFGETGVMWSFNYLFYNKGLKRITMFYCRASSMVALEDAYMTMGSADQSMVFDDWED